MNETEQAAVSNPLPSTGSSSIDQLVTEVERMRKHMLDYNAMINRKMDQMEQDVDAMEQENQRLLAVKEGLQIERDACIALAMKLAMASGIRVGVASGNTVVAELPNGQVSWNFNETEAHLFETLPPYTDGVESLTIEENYGRVMNYGVAEVIE